MSEKFIIGIDLGGTNLKIALLDSKFRIKYKESLSTRKFSDKAELIGAIVSAVNRIMNDYAISKKEIAGVGLGLPGPVDHDKGIVHFFPNIPGWKEVRLKDILERKLNLKVSIDNDAKLMALAEYRQGRARDFKNVLCITLGTGVGGSIIINGKLYRGANNAAGEIGHLPINETGPDCNCGGSACLEAYIGNDRIRDLGRRLFRRDISPEELSDLAKSGNAKALKIWDEVGAHLGLALAGMVNVLNLDAIIIGGGIANAGKFLFDKVNKVIRARAMTVQAKQVKVFKAELGNEAGMIGAGISFMESCA
ncbi:MAG: ROK family protein [Candidatus Omnitrophica bacterium]|nr:ROK family protein [Candidatus Omnitrophota bacterium]